MRLVSLSGSSIPLVKPLAGGIFTYILGIQLVEQVLPPAAQAGNSGSGLVEQVPPPAVQEGTRAQPAVVAAVGPFFRLLAEYPEVVNSS